MEKGQNEVTIKKETMIKKNIHDIKEVYEMDSAVSSFLGDQIQKLGSGSYGVVHKAIHRTTRQERAIKVIAKSKIKNMDRFRTEVKIMQKLVNKFHIFVGPS